MAEINAPSEQRLNLCNGCKEVDAALDLYYEHHRNGAIDDWQKLKYTLGTLDELSHTCACCLDIAASLPAFNDPYSPVNKFRLVIDDTDIMLKYKVPRNMRGGLETDYLFLLPTEPKSETLEHATPFDPAYFDLKLVQRWVERCETLHGEACCPAKKVPLPGLDSILLIDVVDWCVVSAPPEARYVALSYCWGQTAAARALKHNISVLKTPGAISPSTTSFKIPRTIADAMTFTIEIGERYLWVDSLCIIQDDYNTKQLHLDSMAFIYANSYFTLVAAEGPNADHGLRGVGASKRDLPIHKIRLPSGSLVLNKPRAGFRLDSIWNSRGWTLQESLFSRRLILFDGFVSWVCCEGEWSEDTDRELDLQGSSSFLLTDRVGLYGRLPLWPDLQVWGSLVSQFNKRDLTFDKDVIDAFAGIETAGRPSFPGGFLLGMPQFFFDIAMLWQPERRLIRRINGRSNHLPSWSWVGWKGEIETQLWGASSALPYNERYPLPEITIEPLVQWKALKSPDYPEHHAIPNSYAVHRSKAAPYAGWTEHQNNRATHYTHDKVPDQYFRYPVPLLEDSHTPSPAKDLCFLSLTAMRSCFKIGGILEDRFAEQERFGRDPFAFNVSILDAANRAVGALRLNLEYVNEAPIGEECELITISAGTARIGEGQHSYLWKRDEWALKQWHDSVSRGEGTPVLVEGSEEEESGGDEWEDVEEDETYNFFNVLWIERSGGTCYRKALGRMIQGAWVCSELTDIVLG